MADPSSETQVIPLGRMPQQVGVREAQDDWTGVINRKERRKLQNRLNQRRFRLRKQDSQAESHATDIATTAPSNLSNPSILHPLDRSGEMWECKLAPPHAREFREWFAAKAYQSYMQGAPKRDHLISLSRLNVHRAINENITAIGMTPVWMQSDDSISIFNLTQPGSGFPIDSIPLCLRPTFIQLSIPHHPWLDFFPFPSMRDAMILAGDSFDDDDLCHDLMAFWDTQNTAATLLVWGDSWDAGNWEVTEAFARKWKWLLGGSPELLASTNRWRRWRGEKPLAWKDVLSSP